jgi:copper chaperone CopZ
VLTRIKISGMSCSRCVQAVYTALTPVEGIVRLDIGIGWAELEHDGRATVDALAAAIGVAGYEVELASEEATPARRRLPVL